MSNKNNRNSVQSQTVAKETVEEQVVDVVETPAVEEVIETVEEQIEEQVETNSEEIQVETPAVEEVIETEPEIKVEPVVVEQPEVVVNRELNLDQVKELLVQPGMSIHDKLVILSNEGDKAVKKIAAKLLDYNAEASTKLADRGPKVIAAKNYDLYSTIKTALETPEYEMFKVKFDIINLAFIAFKDDSFNEYAMRRGVEVWSWGDKAFNTYSNIVTCITILGPLATRTVNQKKIDYKKLLENTTLNETSKENIKRYYQA